MPARPARVEEDAPLVVTDSAIQAPRRPGGLLPALSADSAGTIGVEASVERSTIVGSVHVSELDANDSAFTHRVEVARTQAGCMRFSFVARGDATGVSRTPQRYRCEPDQTVARETDLARARAAKAETPFGAAEEAAVEQRVLRAVAPQFVATSYGDPAYLQLSDATSQGIASGSSSGSEMGVLAGVMAPIRIQNLRRALNHYTRYGTEVGILSQT